VFHWNASGSVEAGILDVAQTWSASLIVAVSEGRRDYFDQLRGSTMERLVASAKTPVLVVPADWGAHDAS
jgi:nucleotide-binding universal stress UspA family protein